MLNCTFDDIKFAASVVGNDTLPSEVEMLTEHGKYNCWGFTAYVLKLYNELTWLRSHTMDNILETMTIEIKRVDLRAGDIAVYRNKKLWDDLEHTAIVIDPIKGTIIHKDGSRPLEMDKIYNVFYAKQYGRKNVTFRRVKSAA